MNAMFASENLTVHVGDRQILQEVSFTLTPGRVIALMGPNGSGKSSLALTLMGHPAYVVISGSILFNGQPIQELSPDKRAKLGLFLATQHPLELEGVSVKEFLHQAYNALHDGTDKQLRIRDFHQLLIDKVRLLGMDESFIDRHLNVGFSGGEKKRAEMLQLAVLQPKIAILDEIDSGLDVDAFKAVCNALNVIRQSNPELSLIIITHYKRLLEHIIPDEVHLLRAGSIVRTGTMTLADHIEAYGYAESTVGQADIG